MTRIIKTVVEPRDVQKEVGFTCNFCGRVYVYEEGGNDRYDWHDGFRFAYRPGEEDQLVIEAPSLCDICYDQSPVNDEFIPKLLALILQYAPHAEILAPLWGDYPYPED